MKQHKANVRFANKNSGIFQHVKNENHSIKWDEGNILFNFKDFYISIIVESILIKNTFNNNINMNTRLFNDNNIIEKKNLLSFKNLKRFYKI